MLRLDGMVALVTGCGSVADGWGNGKATAVLLARQGAKVYGCDVNLDAAQETQRIIIEEGGDATVQEANVTQHPDVRALVENCVSHYGRIDVLVNNVGRSEAGDPVTMAEEVWDAQIDINLKAAFLCCKHVLPVMESIGGGSIVNISSVAALRHVGGAHVAYAAAKAALMQMTATTAVVYAARRVRLNCVAPGLMHTPLVHRLMGKHENSELDSFIGSRHKQVPMGHMGTGWDVAHAVLFLASNESRYITGQNLIVDGGLTVTTR